MECAERCDCGQGNGCDAETGECMCNSCWQYDGTNMNCTTSEYTIATCMNSELLSTTVFFCSNNSNHADLGYDCFLDFLAIADKVLLSA